MIQQYIRFKFIEKASFFIQESLNILNFLKHECLESHSIQLKKKLDVRG